MIAVCIATVEIDSAEATSSILPQDVSSNIAAANRKILLNDIEVLVSK